MAFHIGQKAVCVDDDNRNQRAGGRDVNFWLKVGNIYIVRKVSTLKRNLVWLQGINRRETYLGEDWSDSGFWADRFRPLIERKTESGVAVLRKIADDASRKVPAAIVASTGD